MSKRKKGNNLHLPEPFLNPFFDEKTWQICHSSEADSGDVEEKWEEKHQADEEGKRCWGVYSRGKGVRDTEDVYVFQPWCLVWIS